MTREEAIAALGTRYRLRIVVELAHHGVGRHAVGSTMVSELQELDAAATTLLRRLLAAVTP